jgi:hypothetical protein
MRDVPLKAEKRPGDDHPARQIRDRCGAMKVPPFAVCLLS